MSQQEAQQSKSPLHFGRKPQRKLRNYLLDARFQLKYTAMVVIVAVAVASVLGWLAYRKSKEQSEGMMAQQAVTADAETFAYIMEEAKGADQQLLFQICAGVGVLAIALGLTGIVVTHRVVGPAYRLRRLLEDVAGGHLRVNGRLRPGDELQEVFIAFESMIQRLRAEREQELVLIEQLKAEPNLSANAAEAIRSLEKNIVTNLNGV